MSDIPSKEAIRYGRMVLIDLRDVLREGERTALLRGDSDRADARRIRHQFIEHMLGDPPMGAPAPFDARWLDDDFRRRMEQAS